MGSAVARLAPGEAGYPALLAAVPSPPVLWVRGSVTPDDEVAVAIVGSRRATAYGLETARALAGDLASRGVTIVSGLARGIDSAAHRAALDAGGRTIAVLGCGIDVVYPPENAPLAEAIAESGALVSQFSPGTPPMPWHFPLRNRTLAGLALGVVVVEAGERSGALITARLAAELGREVLAVPGRITSELSRGPNGLIGDGARLVASWSDIVQELPERARRSLRPLPETPGEVQPVAGGDAQLVLAGLRPDEPTHIETVIAATGLSPARAAAALLALELSGQARQMEGQRWMAVTARWRP